MHHINQFRGLRLIHIKIYSNNFVDLTVFALDFFTYMYRYVLA